MIHFDPGSLSSLFQNQKFDLDIMTDDVNVKVLESPVVGRFTFDPDMPFDDNMLTAAEGGGEIQQIVDSLDEMFTIEVIPAVNDKEKVEEMPKLTIEDLQPQIGQV